MAYIDGFVAAVPTANREKYQAHVISDNYFCRSTTTTFAGLGSS